MGGEIGEEAVGVVDPKNNPEHTANAHGGGPVVFFDSVLVGVGARDPIRPLITARGYHADVYEAHAHLFPSVFPNYPL